MFNFLNIDIEQNKIRTKKEKDFIYLLFQKVIFFLFVAMFILFIKTMSYD